MPNKLLTVVAHPFKNLVQYKSFLFLMLLLCVAERTIKHLKSIYHLNVKLPAFWRMSADTSAFMLFQFPDMVVKKMSDPRLIAMIAALFLLKKALTLWPASDMRRMHREERGRFGLVAAVGAIGWRQWSWFFAALLVWCGLVAGWFLLCFTVCRFGWRQYPNSGWLWGLGISIALTMPLVLAGFSFSSRLAVQTGGTMARKLVLLLKTCTSWRVVWRAWLFFLAWIVVEALFISGTTIYVLTKIEHGAVRFAMAAILATPFYAYLELAAFKLFLVAFETFPVVRQEYENYFVKEKHGTDPSLRNPRRGARQPA